MQANDKYNLFKTSYFPSGQPTDKQLIWMWRSDIVGLIIKGHLTSFTHTHVIFYLFLWKKSSTECGSCFWTFIKKWFIEQKIKKAIKVLGKSTEKLHKLVVILGWIIIWCPCLLVLPLYIYIKYIDFNMVCSDPYFCHVAISYLQK